MSERGTETEVRPTRFEPAVDFVQVLEQHRARVLATCRRVTGCPEEARDMAQDIWLKVYQGLPRFEHRASFRTWLDRIKANHVMNQRSPMQRRRMIYARRRVRKALVAMSPTLRVPLLLYERAGNSAAAWGRRARSADRIVGMKTNADQNVGSLPPRFLDTF